MRLNANTGAKTWDVAFGTPSQTQTHKGVFIQTNPMNTSELIVMGVVQNKVFYGHFVEPTGVISVKKTIGDPASNAVERIRKAQISGKYVYGVGETSSLLTNN